MEQALKDIRNKAKAIAHGGEYQTYPISCGTLIAILDKLESTEKANAAAPELLEALEQITSIPFHAYGDNEAACKMIDIAAQAIVKAKGE